MRCLTARRAVIVTWVVLLAFAAPVTSATAQVDSTLSLRSLEFENSHVNADGPDPTINKLRWRVINADADANTVGGRVDIRLQATDPGTFLGLPHEVGFNFGETFQQPGVARWVSGTPQNSIFEYEYVVPRYAHQKKATWAVSTFTAQDDLGHVLTVEAGFPAGSTFTARSLVDRTPPTHDEVVLACCGLRPYLYVKDRPGFSAFETVIRDQESTFWKGTLHLTGPSGQAVDSDFTVVIDSGGNPSCGGSSGGGAPQEWPCHIEVRVPANSAAGVWTVSGLTLFDNAGNRSTSTLTGPTLTVTSNEVVSATDFTATPNPVNNWRSAVDVEIGMRVAGAQQGISEIVVDLGDFESLCRQLSTTPNSTPDGRVAVTFRMEKQVPQCRLNGVRVVDGAGNIALYGRLYSAPDPGLVVRRLVNTTPPTVTEATVTPQTIPVSELPNQPLEITLRVVAPIAPATSFDLDVFDASGNIISSLGGSLLFYDDGRAVIFHHVFPAPVGTYTIGFTIFDASGLRTTYGPEGEPMPGGPLQFAVVPD
jgi:hypothetical protein